MTVPGSKSSMRPTSAVDRELELAYLITASWKSTHFAAVPGVLHRMDLICCTVYGASLTPSYIKKQKKANFNGLGERDTWKKGQNVTMNHGRFYTRIRQKKSTKSVLSTDTVSEMKIETKYYEPSNTSAMIKHRVSYSIYRNETRKYRHYTLRSCISG